MITGHGEIEVAIKSLQLEASDFITKPINDEALFIALDRAEKKIVWRRMLEEYKNTLKAKVQEATAELKKTYAFQENLLQSSLDGIIGTDEKGHIIIFNPSVQALSGYILEEIQAVEQPLSLLLPEWAEFIAQGLEDAGAVPIEKRSLIQKMILPSKTGKPVPVRVSGTLLIEGDRLAGSVCFLQDLREIEKLERELLRSERLAATGQTVAGLAHAIKNILGGLKGGRFMVNKGFELNEMKYLKEGWAMVDRNIEKISQLTLDLLNFSKEREPERTLFNLNDMIREVYDLYQNQAGELGIHLTLDLDQQLGMVELDPKGIYQVISNLVTNALDACALEEPANKDKAFEVCMRSQAFPDKILVEVKDNGMGMDEQVRKKLFTIFFSTKTSRGTGLGLLLSHKIVQEHGGEIRVTSVPHQGSTFQVLLPRTEYPKMH